MRLNEGLTPLSKITIKGRKKNPKISIAIYSTIYIYVRIAYIIKKKY